MKLDITITKTADGGAEYVQVISDDMLSVNVVLVADEVTVTDFREPRGKKCDGKKEKKKSGVRSKSS